MEAAATFPHFADLKDSLEDYACEPRGRVCRDAGALQILSIDATVRGCRFDGRSNPHRGCEFGCVYCYARYTHEFLELRDPMDFERKIFVKRMAAQVLGRTLSRTPIGTDAIDDGTATDPYQPAERKYGLTRSMLEVFAQLAGLNLSITTKSSLIVRDLELLKKINRRSKLSVNFSVITLDRRLQRILEPRAPRPGLRLRALFELARAGIRCNVLMMPMIPGLTDDPAAIESVIRAANRAGASGVWWRSLFLKPAAARRFIPYVKERFPHLCGRIDAFYAHSGVCSVHAWPMNAWGACSIDCAQDTDSRSITSDRWNGHPSWRRGLGNCRCCQRNLTPNPFPRGKGNNRGERGT